MALLRQQPADLPCPDPEAEAPMSGYVMLIAVRSVPVGAGSWILVRPEPVPLGIGTVVGGGYGGLVLRTPRCPASSNVG
jgi:hypothetical protein